ncbi:MAG: SDR family oxidoreductase [Phycisphaerales bacterium]|nr:MAG: SDR family oxidoreductase [Phycisphaerales bacterium]
MESGRFNLAGKTALVTGGNRGIGFAIARGLAEHGADVVLVARTAKELAQAKTQIQKQTQRRVWTFVFDLENTEKIEGLFDEIVTQTGGVDILVNCAGITIRSPAEDVSLDMWDRVHRVNLTSVLRMSQAFCRHRKSAGKGGKIINIGSLTCSAARPTTAAYASSKSGLMGLTRTLAVEWAKYSINVNAVGPGYITTELTKPLWSDKDFTKWVLSETPLGRWGQPEDLIGAAVLLASSAGDFITGQTIYVDGGWLAML